MGRRLALLSSIMFLAGSAPAQTPVAAILDTIQHTAFNFFWNEANPANGLIKDRSSAGSPCSIASTGFGLSALCIGVDHGWVSRAAACDRVLTTLKTFWYGPQGSGDAYIGNFGLFYHFLDMNTAKRTWNSELSTIDTGLLLAGIVDAREYFDGKDSLETAVRNYADSIYQRMKWSYMRGSNPFGLAMEWQPGTGFSGQWVGYSEASIMYILAMGSPFSPYRLSQYGWLIWTSGYSWINYAGYQYVSFPPLFGHQYSQCWLDLRSINDDYMTPRGITYFENSRRATLAQRAYAGANPGGFPGYSDTLWGLTASDVPPPVGYAARGAPPPQNDDGTITPTAPISSIPFAPEAVIPVIRNMWENYRSKLWTPYGFRDAFNLKANWYDTDIIGIDQGPEIIMIENYLNGRVWKRFMQNADVQRGLAAANFLPVTGLRSPDLPSGYALSQNYPNPFNPSTSIVFTLAHQERVALKIYDMLGRQVATLIDETLPAGRHEALFDARGLSSGVYICRLGAGGFRASRSMSLVK